MLNILVIQYIAPYIFVKMYKNENVEDNTRFKWGKDTCFVSFITGM